MLGRRNPCQQLLPLLPLPHEALGFAASLRGQQCPRAKRSRGAPPPPMPQGWQCAHHQRKGGPPVRAGPHRPSCQLSIPPAPAGPHPPPLRSTAILLGEGISLDLLTSSCSGGWRYNKQLLLGGGTPRVPAASALSCSSFASPSVPKLTLFPRCFSGPSGSHLLLILPSSCPHPCLPWPPKISFLRSPHASPWFLTSSSGPPVLSAPPSHRPGPRALTPYTPCSSSALPTLRLPFLGPAPDFSLPFSYLFPSLVLLLLLPLPVGASVQGKTCVLKGICVRSVPFWVGGEKG